jgi:hypothetical protein
MRCWLLSRAARPERRADGCVANAARIVDRVIKRRRAARIAGHVASGIIQERPCGRCALFEVGQAVRVCGIGVAIGDAIGGFGQAIAVVIVSPKPCAIRPRTSGRAIETSGMFPT